MKDCRNKCCENEFKILYIFTGNQGFPLSAVIDEPNMKVRGFTSTETSVHLICQKNQGVQNPPSQYLIINCQIKISNNFGSVSASIPDLIPFLSSYCTQVRHDFDFGLIDWLEIENKRNLSLKK